VAAAHGLDASGYSFAYVAGWAGGDLTHVRQAAETVTKAARTSSAAAAPTPRPVPTTWPTPPGPAPGAELGPGPPAPGEPVITSARSTVTLELVPTGPPDQGWSKLREPLAERQVPLAIARVADILK